MPRTKSLKELALDYGVHPNTLRTWLHRTFPSWYTPRKNNISKMSAVKRQNKRTYNPKEILLIYDYFGTPTKD